MKKEYSVRFGVKQTTPFMGAFVSFCTNVSAINEETALKKATEQYKIKSRGGPMSPLLSIHTRKF